MLKDKVILVTGGASGIGKAAVEILAGSGAAVSFIDCEKERGAETETQLRNRGYGVDFFYGDVTNSARIDEIVAGIRLKRGTIDVLVNNAAVQMSAAAAETQEEDWDRIFRVNIKGYYICAKAVLPAMRRARSGVIINVTSVQGISPGSACAAYASSKGAIITFTKTLAHDYGRDNIRAIAVAPGAIDAPLLHLYNSPEAIQRMKQAIPLDRLGRPEEIGELIAFLASGKCAYMTGSVVVADGGLSSCIPA